MGIKGLGFRVGLGLKSPSNVFGSFPFFLVLRGLRFWWRMIQAVVLLYVSLHNLSV